MITTSDSPVDNDARIARDERQELDELRARSNAARAMFLAAFIGMWIAQFLYPDNTEMFLAIVAIGLIGIGVHEHHMGKTDWEQHRLEQIHSRPAVKRREIRWSAIISGVLGLLLAAQFYFIQDTPLTLSILFGLTIWASNFALTWWQSIRPKPQRPADAD